MKFPIFVLFFSINFFYQIVDIYFDLKGNVDISNTGELEEDTAEPAVRGKSLEAFLEEFKTLYNSHIHPTPMGPSGVVTQPWVPNHVPYQQENK